MCCFIGSGQKNTLGIPIEATFSPDSEYIFCGSTDGHVHAYNNKTGLKVAELESKYNEAITNVQFNPKYMMLATASSDTAFWVPTAATI